MFANCRTAAAHHHHLEDVTTSHMCSVWHYTPPPPRFAKHCHPHPCPNRLLGCANPKTVVFCEKPAAHHVPLSDTRSSKTQWEPATSRVRLSGPQILLMMSVSADASGNGVTRPSKLNSAGENCSALTPIVNASPHPHPFL